MHLLHILTSFTVLLVRFERAFCFQFPANHAGFDYTIPGESAAFCFCAFARWKVSFAFGFIFGVCRVFGRALLRHGTVGIIGVFRVHGVLKQLPFYLAE